MWFILYSYSVVIFTLIMAAGLMAKARQVPLLAQTDGLPKILLIRTGSALPVPSTNEKAKSNEVPLPINVFNL